jgi:hypothetical protein
MWGTWEVKREGSLSKENLRPHLKNKPKAKKAGGMTQMVKDFSSKHKTLSSNTSTSKNKKPYDFY